MDRKEAIDNLRVTVRAALATAPQPSWQKFGHEYLRHTEPHTEGRGLLFDLVNARLDTLGVSIHPVLPGRREWYTCKVVKHFLLGLDYFTKDDYMNASLECLNSMEASVTVAELTNKCVVEFCNQVRRSLYGKDAILV